MICSLFSFIYSCSLGYCFTSLLPIGDLCQLFAPIPDGVIFPCGDSSGFVTFFGLVDSPR